MSGSRGSRWQDSAVCFQETPDAPELWTPDRKPHRAVWVHLERMCQRCPVERACAAEAVDTGAAAGMYAGVWVPELSSKKAWVAAREQLARIASGAGVDDAGSGVLGVSA